MRKAAANGAADVLDALEHASETYYPSDFGKGNEHDLPDPYLTACFGDDDPTLRPAFAEVADRVHFFVVKSAGDLKPWQ